MLQNLFNFFVDGIFSSVVKSFQDLKRMSKIKPHGISIQNELLKASKDHARRNGRSFSGHVCWLLRKDIYGAANDGSEPLPKVEKEATK